MHALRNFTFFQHDLEQILQDNAICIQNCGENIYVLTVECFKSEDQDYSRVFCAQGLILLL